MLYTKEKAIPLPMELGDKGSTPSLLPDNSVFNIIFPNKGH